MAKTYKGMNLNGEALMHYRTKGSRNGYSKNSNYRPVGQRATGRLVNGRYVYDDPYLSSYGKLQKAGVNEAVRSIDNGAKNNWQQQANETSATNRMLNEHIQKRTTNVIMPNNNTTHKAMQKHNIFTKGWDGAVDNSYANASARVAAGKRVSTPQRTQVASAKSIRDKAIAKGAKNNWQQMGNEHRAANELTRDYYNKKIGDYTAEGFSKNKNGEYNVGNDVKNRWEKIYERRENAEKTAKEASAKGEANNWQEIGTKTSSIHNVGHKLAAGTSKGARFGSSSGVSDKDIESLNNVIVRNHVKRQAAKGAKNNWQQAGNLTRSMTEVSRDLRQKSSGKKAREKRNSKKETLISKIKGLFSKKK